MLESYLLLLKVKGDGTTVCDRSVSVVYQIVEKIPLVKAALTIPLTVVERSYTLLLFKFEGGVN